MKDKINSYISGMGFYAPENIIDNEYFTQFMDTSDQWISERTGIKQRRFVNKGQGPADIAVPAVEMALKNANLTVNDIDFIIEDNPLKHNKYIPGTGIKITDKESIDTKKVDTVIVMAWNFFDTIVKKNKEEFIESEFIPLK